MVSAKASILLLVVAAAMPAAAQPAPPRAAVPRALTTDERMTLRCSAAFAIVSAAQARGVAAAQRYPALGTRGREFFVVAAARLMDEAGLDQAGIKAAVAAEAAALQRAGVDPVMPLCLGMLAAAEQSVPPAPAP